VEAFDKKKIKCYNKSAKIGSLDKNLFREQKNLKEKRK